MYALATGQLLIAVAIYLHLMAPVLFTRSIIGVFMGVRRILPKFPQTCPKKLQKMTSKKISFHVGRIFHIKALQASNFPQTVKLARKDLNKNKTYKKQTSAL